MGKIEELIKTKCPNGVKFLDLENCCNILDNKRKPVTKSARKSGEYPYYGANGIQDYVADYIFDGKYVLVGEDGSVINENGNPIVTWAEGKIWVNNHAHIIEGIDGISLRYLYHYIQTINVTSLIHGNIPKLNQGDFRKLQIAVPPLEVQDEIVHILDDFMLLSAELSAELKARQRQYEYYREKLLSFENAESLDTLHTHTHGYYLKDIRLVKLGDVCVVCAGGTPSKTKEEYWKNGEIKWLGSSVCKNKKCVDEITGYITDLGLKNSSAKIMKEKTTLIAMVGATIGKVAFLSFKATTNQNVACLYPKDENVLNPDYLYYACSNLYSKFIEFSNGKFAMASLNFIKNLEITLPNIKEQEKIVNILDRFEKICNDLIEGIPAEIDARLKQYEYYRDKLLNFKEVEENV